MRGGVSVKSEKNDRRAVVFRKGQGLGHDHGKMEEVHDLLVTGPWGQWEKPEQEQSAFGLQAALGSTHADPQWDPGRVGRARGVHERGNRFGMKYTLTTLTSYCNLNVLWHIPAIKCRSRRPVDPITRRWMSSGRRWGEGCLAMEPSFVMCQTIPRVANNYGRRWGAGRGFLNKAAMKSDVVWE